MDYHLGVFKTDDNFYDQFPSVKDMKEAIEKLFRERKKLENLFISGWDEQFGYAQIKRNIAYLNNQIIHGPIEYEGDVQIVLVKDNKIISDSLEGPKGSKNWILTNNEKIRAIPNYWTYIGRGIFPRVMVPEIETYFLTYWDKPGDLLKTKNRVINVQLFEPINTSDIFDPKNIKNHFGAFRPL